MKMWNDNDFQINEIIIKTNAGKLCFTELKESSKTLNIAEI